jgi:hypothetical protein
VTKKIKIVMEIIFHVTITNYSLKKGEKNGSNLGLRVAGAFVHFKA